MKNRVDIKNFILKIEADFPVNEWKISGIHLWPILRIRLFFYLINHTENKNNQNRTDKKKRSSFATQIKNRLREYYYILRYFIFISSLPKKKYLFVGADSHRVNYKGARFNRYFDVLIEKNNCKKESIYFEYGEQYSNQYNKENVFKFKKALLGFLKVTRVKKKKDFFSVGYDEFLRFLQDNEIFSKFIEVNNKEPLEHWFTESFEPKITFFKTSLQKINPEKIAILCYYSEDIFALIQAANELKIETIEMQHGPQTDIHLCYGSWSKIPKEGYSLLPRIFWCWDLSSSKVIEKWALASGLYSVKVVGNPWVEYWKLKKESYEFDNFILYSLQPNPLSLEEMFTEDIIELVKTSTLPWFVRLHPRQLSQRTQVIDFFERKGILTHINYRNASNDPLPLLLSKAALHVTHFSGSTIEASEMNIPTILFNESGKVSFADLINEQKAFYLDFKDANFKDKFLQLVDKIKKTPKKTIFAANKLDTLFE